MAGPYAEKGNGSHVMVSEFTANHKFLVYSAQFLLTAHNRQSLQSILTEKGLHWESLLEEAHIHGLVPVIHKHLQDMNWKDVPDFFHFSLEEKAHHVSDKNLRIAGEMIKILDELIQHTIPCIPIKGPALANFLYGDVGMRQFDDLDILVKTRDVMQVEILLTSLGYSPAMDLTQKQKIDTLSQECEYNFVHEISGLVVELHWGFVPDYVGFPWGYEYFERNNAIQHAAGEVPYIAGEEMCLSLLVHNGLKHGFDRLCWYTDVMALWSKESFDWNKFLILAKETGCENLVGLTMENTQNLFGYHIPKSFRSRIRSTQKIVQLSARLKKNLFTRVDTDPGLAAQLRYHLFLRDGYYRKLSYLFKLIYRPNSFDWRWIKLPDGLYFLYYIIRPVRLLKQYLF